MPANPEVEAYIRQRARALGIDENVAVAVSKAEALNVFDPSKPDLGGDERSSFGPFQLHYGGRSKNMPNAGLGDEFTKATGLHASDPSTWKQQVDFALDTAKRDGWRQWMGAANTGIPRWAGIRGGGGGAAQQTDTKPAQPAVTDGPKGQEVYRPGQPAKQYALPAAGRHPPNPTVGTGGYVVPGADQTPVPVVVAQTPWWQTMAKGIGGMGGIGDFKAGAGGGIPAQPAAARIDQGDTPTIDPQQAEMQRQQLAMAMQRLNSGRLF